VDHSHPEDAVIPWLLLVPALAAAGSAAPITAQQQIPGLAAAGEEGDVLLQADGGARFVISALVHRVGMQATGGNLIDAYLDGADDAFDGMTPWFERTYPRQAAWAEMDVLPAGVRVRGTDTDDDAVSVEQSMVLVDTPSLAGHLHITTTVTNGSSSPRAAFDVGDIIGWGGLRHFAPGPGFALKGRDEPLPWIGGEGDEYAVLLVAGGSMAGPHGSSWSDPVYDAVDIAPGASITYERHLLLGRTIGELTGPAAVISGASLESATVVAKEAGSGVTIANAQLELLDEAGSQLVARTGPDGSASINLPRGIYRIRASAKGRGLHEEGTLTVPSRGPAAVELTPVGRVRLVATDDQNQPMPARFTFRGVDGPDPDLGPPSRAIGGNRVHLASAEQVAMPPGRYLVSVSRGPAWTTVTREFMVSPTKRGDTAPELRVSLRRVLAAKDWLQCDLHTHAAPSFDSAIPLEDGLIAAAAEGIDCIATTDHDVAVDWSEALRSTGLLGHLLWLPGLEITSEEGAGHINAFPWAPELGAWDHRGQTAEQITAGVRALAPGAVVQLNHPLWGNIGLWSTTGLDAATGLPKTHDGAGNPTGAAAGFDAVEVLNGKGVDGFGKVVDAWERSIDAGVRSIAVGNSDSHRIVGQERGSMRTWIRVGEERTASAVVRALKGQGEVVASNAALVHVDVGPGEPAAITITVQAAAWVPLKSVELHAGDPTSVGVWVPRRWERGDAAILEAVEDGQRVWTIELELPREALGGWVLAVVQGDIDLEPWLDVPAYGLSNPVYLSE
jgi:hypothetical protein